jgi:cytochrome c biogenesis protein CcmG/thiol:disulfide interchange protein DsbE
VSFPSLFGVSARAFAVFMGVLAVIALLAFGMLRGDGETVAVGEPLGADDPLPLLDAGASGDTGQVADYRGKWVLVNLWASWCTPCRDESPALQSFHEEHRGDGFTVLGIDTEDNTADALEFVDEFGLSYPQLHDGDGARRDELGMTGVPESVLVDPEGNVAYYRPGPVDAEILRDEIEPLIAGRQ